MKKIRFIFLGAYSITSLASSTSEDLSLEEILNIPFYTASKEAETLNKTSSITSVITSTEIQRMGLRTLYEVLARVPGFFPSTQATWTVVGSRGLQADGNDHLLLLIDGHPQNSILSSGYQQQDMIPNLDKVERIEIIRGPGSVLWGSAAAYGIINVITKDRLAEGDNKVSFGYGSADGMQNMNVLQNVGDGKDIKGLISLTGWQSKGYGQNQPYAKFPWGQNTNKWPTLDEHRPSFELSGKVKFKEKDQLIARVVQTRVTYPWDSWSWDGNNYRSGGELMMRKAYLVYKHQKDYSDKLSVEYSTYGDLMTQERYPTGIGKNLGDPSWTEMQSREEMALGLEANGKYQFNETNALKFGFKGVRTQVGPNMGFRFNSDTNLPTTPGATQNQVNVLDIPNGTDHNGALYAEHKIDSAQKRTSFFYGARLDSNDWRERKTVFLPRVGLIHSFENTDVTAKLIYNTGYLRPNAAYSKSGGKFFRSPSKTIQNVSVVDKGETVQSLDFQLNYSKNKNYFAATFFLMKISNYITWETQLDLGYRTMGNATSHGMELEGKYAFSDFLALNSNYSYAVGRLDNIPYGTDVNGVSQRLDRAITNSAGHFLNYPTHIFNLGLDVILNQKNTINCNIRHWREMTIIGAYDSPKANQFDRLNGEFYFDISYRANDIWNDVNLNVFAMNLFNNTHPVGMVINNGTFQPRGANFGLNLSRTF